mmetsp:Transcript_48283/g.118509  ORF Transcript_48283/g.118509 Transcript_48283/m.118509 type:complete len:83 (-) Transcript_48283:81-329(-)
MLPHDVVGDSGHFWTDFDFLAPLGGYRGSQGQGSLTNAVPPEVSDASEDVAACCGELPWGNRSCILAHIIGQRSLCVIVVAS